MLLFSVCSWRYACLSCSKVWTLSLYRSTICCSAWSLSLNADWRRDICSSFRFDACKQNKICAAMSFKHITWQKLTKETAKSTQTRILVIKWRNRTKIVTCCMDSSSFFASSSACTESSWPPIRVLSHSLVWRSCPCNSCSWADIVSACEALSCCSWLRLSVRFLIVSSRSDKRLRSFSTYIHNHNPYTYITIKMAGFCNHHLAKKRFCVTDCDILIHRRMLGNCIIRNCLHFL